MRVQFNNEIEGKYAEIRRYSGGWISDCGPVTVEGSEVLTRDSYRVLMKNPKEGTVIRFSDLHRHSDGSLLDGLSRPSEIAELTEYGGALTDHGNMYNFVDYYKAMKKAGKKPILGFEAYSEDLEGNLTGNHLIFLAKNEKGYRNLFKLTSEASDHFYRKPHVTFKMMEKYHEGVICLSGCLAGLIPKYFSQGKPDLAKEAALRYRDIFGDDFYLEFQRHGIPEEESAMRNVASLGRELGIKVVATTDSHYPKKDDALAHEVMLCLQTKKMIAEDHMTFDGAGYHIQSSEEMEERFKDHPEFLDETLNLEDKVDLEIDLKTLYMPEYRLPEGFADDKEYLKHLAKEGFKMRFKGTEHYKDSRYLERLKYEYQVVCDMGFASYFLIVWDYVNWARENGVVVGPGRGSCVGSLLAYCLRITELDPIKYDLFFERFLNPSRVSMPDIDMDFAHTGRSKVLEYVEGKYGSKNVSGVITFGTLGAKMVVRDVARVLGKPAAEGDKFAKLIPQGPDVSLADAYNDVPDFRRLADGDMKEVYSIACRLEGLKRHRSRHACAQLLSSIPISDALPTEVVRDKDEEASVTQVEGPKCEDLGLLKMHFLGLKNLTVIDECLRTARKAGLTDITDYITIPLTDRATYKMLAEGRTGGVFQLESPGMTKVVEDMLYDVDSTKDEDLEKLFERLIAAVALYRPGPIDYIPDYIAGLRDPGNIHYDCPEEEGILSSTFGVMVYQEQVMQIVRTLAGYNMAEADTLRKALSFA